MRADNEAERMPMPVVVWPSCLLEVCQRRLDWLIVADMFLDRGFPLGFLFMLLAEDKLRRREMTRTLI